ncbi:MAG TPA: DNA-3-methyladenine glycosylase [Chloroflexota bacterium]|nr:DNA-3-methyladenine glycosylase [Chloroflexota bacterium]
MPDGTPLTLNFFTRPVLVVARELLGKSFVLENGGIVLAARIVETEAYQSDIDQASHAFRGRTPRNASMFGPSGHLYVYRSYGIHYCMNVVTTHGGGPASAVLIRAMEAQEGEAVMAGRRGTHDHWALLRGPGNLCQALGIDLSFNGRDLLTGNPTLLDAPPPTEPVMVTTRIGISRAQDFPWRYYLAGNAAVSRRDRRAESGASG